MKNRVIKILSIMALGVSTPLLATSFVSITNPSITPTPLNTVENHGEGIATFSLQETFGGTAPAIDSTGNHNIEVSVNLNKLKLTNEDVSQMSGSLLDYFTVTYNASEHKIIFNQKTDYPSFQEATVDIPVTVVENSTATDVSLNGFNVNMSANDSDTIPGIGGSSFTYTKSTSIETTENVEENESVTLTQLEVLTIGNVNVNEFMPTTVTTTDKRPEINGTCNAGDVVTVEINIADIRTNTNCTIDGTFSITPNKDIADGYHTVSVSQSNPITHVTSSSFYADFILIDNGVHFDIAVVSMSNASISPAVLDTVENNGEGVITFKLNETSGKDAPVKDIFGDRNIKISIELSKLGLKNGDTSLLSGDLLLYFTASYNNMNHRITLRQRADYPGLREASINIPVTVLENSEQTDISLNGFNANISANDNGTTAKGNAYFFTHTQNKTSIKENNHMNFNTY